jgi:hypothetical protein
LSHSEVGHAAITTGDIVDASNVGQASKVAHGDTPVLSPSPGDGIGGEVHSIPTWPMPVLLVHGSDIVVAATRLVAGVLQGLPPV